MIELNEEYNRLIKVKLYNQGGNNQWRLLPVSKKDGSEIRRKDITFRGSDEKLILLLRRLKAKDAATDPPSAKNRTYQQMIDTARDKSDPFIWVWMKIWNNYKDGKKIVNYESIPQVINALPKFSSRINDMLHAEIERREDELRLMYKDYLRDMGKRSAEEFGDFYAFAKTVVAAEEGLIESVESIIIKSIVLEKDLYIPKTNTLIEKGNTIEILKEERLPQEYIVRGSVRDKPVNYFPSEAKKDYGLVFDDVIGWFANKYNLAGGWFIFKASDSDKREFGRDAFRSYSENTNSTSIIRISLKTGTYAFIDNDAYEQGIIRFEKMTKYDRIYIEPTQKAFNEFNIV